MKKTLLLLFSIGTLTAAFAQDHRYPGERNDTRSVILGRDDQRSVYDSRTDRDNRNNRYNLDYRRREEIQRVSRDYDRRIEGVERDHYLRSKEKKREVKRLQREKEQAVRNVNAKYQRLAYEEKARDEHRRY